MSTRRPLSTFTVFPQPTHSTSTRRKSRPAVARSRRSRNASTQIQIRRNTHMEFWKLVKPMNQAAITTGLYHEVLTEIYKERVSTAAANTAPYPGSPYPSSPQPSHLSDHHGAATDTILEEERQQPQPIVCQQSHQWERQALPETQRQPSVFPQREDSLLPPPLVYGRQNSRDRPSTGNRRLGFVPPEQIQRQVQHHLSEMGDTVAPLNFSRLDRRSVKDKHHAAGVVER